MPADRALTICSPGNGTRGYKPQLFNLSSQISVKHQFNPAQTQEEECFCAAKTGDTQPVQQGLFLLWHVHEFSFYCWTLWGRMNQSVISNSCEYGSKWGIFHGSCYTVLHVQTGSSFHLSESVTSGTFPCSAFYCESDCNILKLWVCKAFQNMIIGKIIHMKLLRENSSWTGLGKSFKCCQAEFCASNTWAGGPTASWCLSRGRAKCSFHLQQ